MGQTEERIDYLERGSRDLLARLSRLTPRMDRAKTLLEIAAVAGQYSPPTITATPVITVPCCGSVPLPQTITLVARTGTHSLTWNGSRWESAPFTWSVTSIFKSTPFGGSSFCSNTFAGGNVSVQWVVSSVVGGVFSIVLSGEVCSAGFLVPTPGTGVFAGAVSAQVVCSPTTCSPFNLAGQLGATYLGVWGFFSGDTVVVYG